MIDRRWYRTIALAVALAACGGRNSPGGGDPDAATADAVLADAVSIDADQCTGGTLCGSPAMCCAAGNECIDDRCLAACSSGVHCGADLTTCCAAGEVCLSAACVAPGAACGDSYDCEPGQFCEPTLGQCLPQPDPLACELVPQFSDLMVTQEWAYTTDQIISIPVVANLDGTGAPEVVVNLTQQDGAGFPGGRIAILDGRTGGVLLPGIAHNPPTSYGSHGRSTIAIGDVSGDALPDILYASRVNAQFKSLIVAISRTGTVLWTSHDPGGAAHPFTIENAAITLANFDADPMAELVIGGALLDHDGTVLWDQGGNGAGPTLGTNATYTGGIAAVADLDGDGRPEIVTGKQAWKVAWTAGSPASATVTPYWTYAGADGYPAISDLDGDNRPEVVLTASAQVHILDGRTGLLWCGRDVTGVQCLVPGLRTQRQVYEIELVDAFARYGDDLESEMGRKGFRAKYDRHATIAEAHMPQSIAHGERKGLPRGAIFLESAYGGIRPLGEEVDTAGLVDEGMAAPSFCNFVAKGGSLDHESLAARNGGKQRGGQQEHIHLPARGEHRGAVILQSMFLLVSHGA